MQRTEGPRALADSMRDLGEVMRYGSSQRQIEREYRESLYESRARRLSAKRARRRRLVVIVSIEVVAGIALMLYAVGILL